MAATFLLEFAAHFPSLLLGGISGSHQLFGAIWIRPGPSRLGKGRARGAEIQEVSDRAMEAPGVQPRNLRRGTAKAGAIQ